MRLLHTIASYNHPPVIDPVTSFLPVGQCVKIPHYRGSAKATTCYYGERRQLEDVSSLG